MDRVPCVSHFPINFSRLERKSWLHRFASGLSVSVLLACGQATADTTPIIWPTQGWQTATPASMGMDEALLLQAKNYALKSGGSGLITRSGKAVYQWGSQTQLYQLKSSTKSVGVTALGLALKDGLVTYNTKGQSKLASLGLPPQTNADTGWLGDITMLQLASHSAGFDKPGGYMELLYQPGTMWNYSDGGANWLADVLTVTFQQDLKQVMFSRVFTPLGITSSDLTWRDNLYRETTINGIPRREFGSGVSIDVDAMARFGYLYLRRGVWEGKTILPATFVDRLSKPEASLAGMPVAKPGSYPDATNHYGLLWWNNGDGTMADVPKDAFWSWGLGDSLIIVVPSLDLVIARVGNGWRSGWDSNYDYLDPFLGPIARSVSAGANTAPEVDAGADQTVSLPVNWVDLYATVSDDGLPSSNLSINWSLVSGPGTVTFSDKTASETTATFSKAGEYTLQISVSDGNLVTTDTVVVTVTSASGAYLSFDGVDDVFTVKDNPLLKMTAAITVETWIKPMAMSSTKDQDRVLSKDSTLELTLSSGDTGCSFGTSGDVQWRATIGGVNRRICAGSLTLGDWHHLAGTYDGKKFALYIDGSLAASTSRTGLIATNTTNLYIGNNKLGDHPFSGDLREVRIWNRALSAAEVNSQMNKALAGNEAGLVAYYPLNKGSGQIGVDATVNGNSGVLGSTTSVEDNDPHWESDLTGTPEPQYALRFDGANDLIRVADSPLLDMTAAVTVEAWINPTTISSTKDQDRVFSKDSNMELMLSSGDTGCSYGTSGQVQWRMTVGGVNRRICGGSLSLGSWHHLAGTYDGANYTLYIDGAVAATAPRSGLIGTNNIDLFLGNSKLGNKPFHGDLKEVRVWNRALSASEIASQMNKSLIGSEAGLVAYYPMDKGSGQVVVDSTGNGGSGTLGLSVSSEDIDPEWVSY